VLAEFTVLFSTVFQPPHQAVLVNKLDASRTHAGVKERPPCRGTGPAHTTDVWGKRVGGLDARMLNIHQSKLWDATIDSALAMRALNWSANTNEVGSHGFTTIAVFMF